MLTQMHVGVPFPRQCGTHHGPHLTDYSSNESKSSSSDMASLAKITDVSYPVCRSAVPRLTNVVAHVELEPCVIFAISMARLNKSTAVAKLIGL